jgi:hypothetical protein
MRDASRGMRDTEIGDGHKKHEKSQKRKLLLYVGSYFINTD